MDEKKFVNDLLNYDAFADAEKACEIMRGKSDTIKKIAEEKGLPYKEIELSTPTEVGFLFNYISNHVKRSILHDQGDTYMGQPVGEFLAVLFRMGFEKVYTKEFEGDNEEKAPDYHYVLWHPGKAILVNMDTYWGGKTINGADAYFHWAEYDGMESHELPLNGCYGFRQNMDIREGFKHRMEQMELLGEFKNPWQHERPWLWLLNYSDKRHDGVFGASLSYYRDINERVLAKLPKEIQEAIKY